MLDHVGLFPRILGKSDLAVIVSLTYFYQMCRINSGETNFLSIH